MKILILAGGFGTRLSEETEFKPKPMVMIGDRPILHHLMTSFSSQGFNEFTIALGYKSNYIKNYFKELCELQGNLLIDIRTKSITQFGDETPSDWKVSLVETGLHTQTGGRIRRIMLDNPSESFLVTYGDGLSNIDVNKLIEFHKKSGALATVTAVHPPARFGSLTLDGEMVSKFGEKDDFSNTWINGGWIVIRPEVVNFIHSDSDSFEFDVLPRLANEHYLNAFKHDGFWQPMDTVRDRNVLSDLANLQQPPWFP